MNRNGGLAHPGGSEGPGGPGGFTLVEVLVALAIVAVALAAGMRAAAGVVEGAQRLADITAAQWCADNQLAALKLSRQFPGVGDADFSCEQLGRQYRGTLRTRPTPNPNFRRVDAVVRNADGQPLLTVTTVASRL
jgi:general secretion pathway protein I